jgi:hypothetical protein
MSELTPEPDSTGGESKKKKNQQKDLIISSESTIPWNGVENEFSNGGNDGKGNVTVVIEGDGEVILRFNGGGDCE